MTNLLYLMLGSIGIKGLSAVVEILTLVLIANYGGVSQYGDYTLYLSLVEAAYFVLFSGSMKLNMYYLSDTEVSIAPFRRTYFRYFVLPTIGLLGLVASYLSGAMGAAASLILLFYFLSFDATSSLLARGRQFIALILEYLSGRLTLLLGLALLLSLGLLNTYTLLAVYGLQYLVIWTLAWLNKYKEQGGQVQSVPIRQLWEYQSSDLASSIVSYAPVIAQYFVGGAFSAGVVGIITVIKRFINFVAGPVAKVFLPEFSQLYKAGRKVELLESYRLIVRIQMVFIGIISCSLIAFPTLILSLFNPDLMGYQAYFVLVAICILPVSALGPTTGLLQMTGQERQCTYLQWASIVAMITVGYLFINDPLFSIYALCVQALLEGVAKYALVCRWFGRNVIPLLDLLLFAAPIAAFAGGISYLGLGQSLAAYIIVLGLSTVSYIFIMLRDHSIRTELQRRLGRGVH